jgi:bacillolysin
MNRSSRLTMAVCVVSAALASAALPRAQAGRGPIALRSASLSDLRAEDARVERMVRAKELRLRDTQPDKLVPGRRMERSDQYHHGVRVYGADVTRQFSAGQVVSVFGAVYDDLDVDTTPAVSEREARRTVEALAGVPIGDPRAGELVVLPRSDTAAALTWRIRAATGEDVREYFVDAHSGRVLLDYSDLQTQSAVGGATGTLGDPKKMSALRSGTLFLAQDGLRPPLLRTYDMKGNPQRTVSAINGFIQLAQSDLGNDSDNVWTDGAVTDAHVYTGLTYDYLYKRFGRRGLNDANIGMTTLVHPVRREDFAIYGSQYPTFYANAVYYGNGMMLYGVGHPDGVSSGGRHWNYASAALDIVAHEVAHGVTDYTSDLIYRNESGALNESFSDIIGTAVEFMFHPAGSGVHRAEYLCSEDAVSPAGIRSLADPRAYGHPDHYSIRFTGTTDNGGVHINSGIPNHVFYLAIEGGTNRTSGITVQGVGAANRAQIETVFYRAVTQLLPANASFSMARAATIQAARDLFGTGSAAERAVTEAWTAVGVQ